MALPGNFGDKLESPGVQQPTGSFNLDAYGLAQAQLTFAFDTSLLVDIIDTYQEGVDYPVNEEALGFRMRSYKYSITSGVGNVSMLKVDYMGVARVDGWTDAQITGVATTTAQPIETHPAFSHDAQTGDPPTTHPAIAGTPSAPLNDAIFVPAPPQPNGALQFSFGGFGVAQGETPNKKAGIRQFLRPMLNVRGQIFFNQENANRAAAMVANIGKTLYDEGDMQTLITPNDAVGALSPEICLLTNASVEPIGYPGGDGSGIAGVKVVYDIMVGGDSGWDEDIYWKPEGSIFG